MLEQPENEEKLLPVITTSDQDLKKVEEANKDEIESLLVKEKNDTEEKTHLEKIFKRIGTELEHSEKKKLSKIYKKYVSHQKSSSRKIRKKSGKALLCFMFQILLPAMEIINLIGVFSIISVMNCCFTLFINSVKSYLGFGGEYNLYFYKEFYEQSMSEAIDFNVMFFMGFLGDFLLKFTGFIYASFLFLVINFGSFFMIDSFEFKNNIKNENEEIGESPKIETYNFFNIIYILIFYLLLFIGVGGSAMLSQQILVDSHDKLQRYFKREEKEKKIEEKLQKEAAKLGRTLTIYDRKMTDEDSDKSDDDLDEEVKDDVVEIKEDTNKPKIIEEEQIDNNIKIMEDKPEEKKSSDNIVKVDENVIEKIEDVGEIKEKEEKDKDKEKKEKEKKKKKKVKRKTEGKFDYFFMICITTIIGYFGKYYFCSILGYQLFEKKENKNYKYFYYYVMIIYATCIILSMLIYGLFSFIFRSPRKKDDKNKKKVREDSYAVYQIFGFTIYKETINTNNEPIQNNFCLCCESIRNCCDEIVLKANCNCIFCDQCDELNFCCCCCCPEYNEEDYTPNQFLFCFFYQGQRKQKWFHSFLVNKTQEELIPYMTLYFFLQLFVIGFNKTYEERDSSDGLDDNLNFLKVFIITFCLFFYITITFSYFSSDFINYKDDDEEKKEDKKKDEEKKDEEKKEEEKEEKKEEEKKEKEKKEEINQGNEEKTKEGKEENKEKTEKKISIFQFISEKSGKTKTSAISQNILNGTMGILLVNGLYCFILSAIYLSKKYDTDQLEEEMKNDYYTFIPVLLNKFYYFTLIYFCLSYSEKKKGLELISGATLISLYITAFNFVINFILYLGTKGLIILQLIFSSFIALFWLFIIIVMIVNSIKEKTIYPIAKSLSLFLCRFFFVCCVLLFMDENMNCCCCDIDEEEKKEEKKDENKLETLGEINVEEEKQEKEEEKKEELKVNEEDENKIEINKE